MHLTDKKWKTKQMIWLSILIWLNFYECKIEIPVEIKKIMTSVITSMSFTVDIKLKIQNSFFFFIQYW